MAYEFGIERWHDFYVTVGAASATLAGLLFVGLSLHLAIVVSHSDVRQLARVTLTNLILVLLVALFMLIPTATAQQTGIELVPSAFGAMFFVARAAMESRRAGLSRQIRPSLLLSRFGLSSLAFVAQGAIGVLFLVGQTSLALNWLVGVIVILLVVAVRNAWDLLVTVAEKRPLQA
ncbi:MAG TPA: hypothetical protein VET26_01125 [Candidatus Sulfotelmatobacter sp.]|nr:hypothetical protein [Candidatus Sulfotelmatobacter sp.]